MSHRSEWIVIGIAGVTCGGKTTIANRLLDALDPVYVFNQDQYFYPDDSPHHVRVEGMAHNNYDCLGAVDNDTMYSDILSTMRGQDRSQSHSKDKSDRFSVPGKKFLVVEGLTCLNYEPVLQLCDARYYLWLEFGECAARRALRVYDPPDVPGYFEACVWPEHLRYKEQISGDPRVRFLHGRDPDVFGAVLRDLAALRPDIA